MKKILIMLALLPSLLYAQNPNLFKDVSDYKFLKHMEVGASVGSTGIGIDIATPVNEHIAVRAGFSFFPRFDSNSAYNMSAAGIETDNVTDLKDKTQKICEYIEDWVHVPVDDQVEMTRRLTFYNAKVLVDWYPFHKKNWHFTTGFYWGTKNLAKVFNTTEEAPTLLGMNMYNDMYEQIQTLDKYEYPTITLGKYSFEMDPETGQEIKEKFSKYGRMRIRVGQFPDGTSHYLEPDENGMLKANATANAFKPYFGFGYKKNTGYDKRWNIGFDAGFLIWGGTPHIYANDGICLVHDVKKVGGIVGQYVDFVKVLPVYPVLEFRMSYSIF
ncbi:MAG: hypothetical protein KBT33_08205 [Prevotellaceae bacterium]|nr:hypothetical protein [Candidatus Minthosoma equi]